jgi:hypothetical protein
MQTTSTSSWQNRTSKEKEPNNKFKVEGLLTLELCSGDKNRDRDEFLLSLNKNFFFFFFNLLKIRSAEVCKFKTLLKLLFIFLFTSSMTNNRIYLLTV